MVVEGKESLDTLMAAIRIVMEDSTFEIKSEVAAEARTGLVCKSSECG